ncbi:hypothetical protein DNTS_018547 [Danionella cerebrum]|uniref:CFA20 domain-containing protein n=1 Tax=Danionella cerebrum TaxID=2873325 RepID=A0A553NHW9_9TELE|nr:hypothetical protein DNTS_018547 [Danionella translucida]
MFRNDYQGGVSVDVFSAQGKDPVAKWKLFGRNPSITKMFDKEVKGFVYSLEGNSQTHKMQLPKDSKTTLGLIQTFLILQVNVPLGKDFSAEFLVTDDEHLKRRLYLSTLHKELSATPLHARIPLTCLKRDIWCNLCIDLNSLTAEIFHGTNFLSLDGIIISACCKLRRIFTMKNEPADCGYGDFERTNAPKEDIPKNCQFPAEVEHLVQMINMKTLQQVNTAETVGIKDSLTKGPTPRDSSHIAFGSVFRAPPPTVRKRSASANRKEERSKSELNLNMPSGTVLANETHLATEKLKRRSEKAQPLPPGEKSVTERTISRRPQRMHNARREKSNPDAEGGRVSLNPEGAELQGKVFSSLKTLSLSSVVGDNLTEPVPQESRADASGSAFKSRSISPPQCALTPDEPDLCDTDTELSLCLDEYQEEDVFTFSSCPHSARRNHASANPDQGLTFGLKGHKLESEGQRKDARLEDDFVGSESEEPAWTGPKRPEPLRIAPTRCLSPPSCSSRQASRHDPWDVATAFPDERDFSVSISRASVREVSLRDSELQKVSLQHQEVSGKQESFQIAGEYHQAGDGEEDLAWLPARKPNTKLTATTLKGKHHRCWLYHGLLRMPQTPDFTDMTSLMLLKVAKLIWKVAQDPGRTWFKWISEQQAAIPADVTVDGRVELLRRDEEDEDELLMLACLKREHEEAEGMASPNLTASQIRHCNISLSVSSDDTSTWTQCIPLPLDQGQYYQKEMNPLLHSNPREWMDVLSPPIVHPNQLMSDGKWNQDVENKGSKDDKRKEEYLNLMKRLMLIYSIVRLHSGVIASVVVVVIGATVAAVLIIRRYCCPLSNVTYRYSDLQQMEEQNTAIEQEDSDEDLLE